MAATTSTCVKPKALRGDAIKRVTIEPTPPPTAMPMRKTANTIEKVYTVAPNASASKRVHTTSPASAQKPDSAIDDSTAALRLDTIHPGRSTVCPPFGERHADGDSYPASASAPKAASTSIAAATAVATTTS